MYWAESSSLSSFCLCQNHLEVNNILASVALTEAFNISVSKGLLQKLLQYLTTFYDGIQRRATALVKGLEGKLNEE